MLKKILFRIGTVLLLISIAILMCIIGRGHTIYFDNKTFELTKGQIDSLYKIEVIIPKEPIIKLNKRERGMATVIGQKLNFSLNITKEKNAPIETTDYTIEIPYNIDNILINLPALLNGLDKNDYMSEFIIRIEEEPIEEIIPNDELLPPE
ncbi:MAG: hypothetical protein Q4F88_01270 [Eubacteriales bacterium]|nr:hypothetical protein [Eubacteriales bacterium]